MADIVPYEATTEPLPPVVVPLVHTAYFDASGKLLLINSGGVMSPPDGAVNAVEVDDPNNFDIYFDGEARGKQDFVLTIERNKVSGIPPGTTVYMSDGVEVVDDGELEFDVNYEGTVDIFLVNPRFISASVSVEVGP